MHLGVIVQEIVELLRARSKSVGLAAPVKGLAQARDAAGLGHVHEGVHVHLGVRPDPFRSDSAIILPMALGMEPIPSCRQAPSGISGTTSLATAISTSEGSPPPPSSSMTGLSPSTIISTSLIWT